MGQGLGEIGEPVTDALDRPCLAIVGLRQHISGVVASTTSLPTSGNPCFCSIHRGSR